MPPFVMTQLLKTASPRTLTAIVFLNPMLACAGGFEGPSSVCCKIAPVEARAMMTAADRYRDGPFQVSHTDKATAAASISTGREAASGSGTSQTTISSNGGVTSWKASVQRGSASTSNGKADSTGFSASFVKVQTADGRFYIYKGYVSATASASPAGPKTATDGFARSIGGRLY